MPDKPNNDTGMSDELKAERDRIYADVKSNQDELDKISKSEGKNAYLFEPLMVRLYYVKTKFQIARTTITVPLALL